MNSTHTILAAIVLVTGSLSWAHCPQYSTAEIRSCEKSPTEIAALKKLSKLRECYAVASCTRAEAWTLPIAYGERILELEPTDVELRGTTVWMLYSQWVIWKNDAQEAPHGVDAVDRALALIDRGLENSENRFNASYYYEMAVNLSPIAYFYKPELYERVLLYLRRTESLSPESETKAFLSRLRGNIHKRLGAIDEARTEYKKSLALNPSDAQTKRALEWLDE